MRDKRIGQGGPKKPDKNRFFGIKMAAGAVFSSNVVFNSKFGPQKPHLGFYL
jgi:hypothetical protein